MSSSQVRGRPLTLDQHIDRVSPERCQAGHPHCMQCGKEVVVRALVALVKGLATQVIQEQYFASALPRN